MKPLCTLPCALKVPPGAHRARGTVNINSSLLGARNAGRAEFGGLDDKGVKLATLSAARSVHSGYSNSGSPLPAPPLGGLRKHSGRLPSYAQF